MRHLDLFSGIGGFALAADWVWGDEHEIVSFVEIDSFCQKVLKKHWPDVPIHGDIKTFDGNRFAQTNINLVTAGIPCQPYSEVGQRRGSKDDRALWPYVVPIIKKTKPNWVIVENVDNFRNMDLEKVLAELESFGFEVGAICIPACAVNANHARERVWVVAYSDSKRPQAGGPVRISASKKMAIWKASQKYLHSLTIFTGRNRGKATTPQSRIPGVDDGIPNRVDRNRSLGNAIVPQVVVPIMQAIKEIEATDRASLGG